MEYKINPMAFAGIFPVPNSLVDENIRLASVVQLKVLLYILRHSNDGMAETEMIADALSLDSDDVKDAMIFWAERGLLIKDGQMPAAAEKKNDKKEEKSVPVKEEKRVAEISVSRPSYEDVAKRIKESDEIVVLLQEAQSVLGRTIGFDGQSVIIQMLDSYGLPPEVILMAIEYSLSLKKTGWASIGRVGRRWSEMEIDTLEGAMEYIEEHNIVDETWAKLRELTEITNRNPTEKQRRNMAAWVKEYGYGVDIIYCAYEESIDNIGKMSFPYMDRVIRSWHEKGVKSLTDIQNERAKWDTERKSRFSKSKKKEDRNEAEASYDIDEYMKKSLELQYVKNEAKSGV
ncbi:MAG: DnaD domain protein [Ruminococcaceae bacterium]|nr:DnaD domain protein [Oscillospiraceae bacterium]